MFSENLDRVPRSQDAKCDYYFDTKSEEDVLQKAGLKSLVNVFKVYGFKLDHNLEKCKLYHPYVALRIIMALAYCIYSAAELFCESHSNGEKVKLERICLTTLLLSTTVGNPITTMHTCLYWKKYSLVIHDLANTIVNITPASIRKYYTKKFRNTFMVIIIVVVLEAFFTITTYVYILVHPDNRKSAYLYDPDNEILVYLQAAIVVVLKLNNTFYHVYETFLVLTCHLMSRCFDHYLIDDNCQTPTTGRQYQHRKLCHFVSQANDLFSSYMLYSLTTETVSVITTVKAIQFYTTITMSASNVVFIAFINFFWLVLKAWLCSAVNNKVTTSLLMNPTPTSNRELHADMEERANYIIYLVEQSIESATLTYGDFFQIRKTVIFTVIGTTITYALILVGF